METWIYAYHINCRNEMTSTPNALKCCAGRCNPNAMSFFEWPRWLPSETQPITLMHEFDIQAIVIVSYLAILYEVNVCTHRVFVPQLHTIPALSE